MTHPNFVLPYRRVSPVHIPRRDLVLSGADSLALTVSIVESDDPDAAALVLTGGIGGPALRMVIWSDGVCSRYSWDYGGQQTVTTPSVLIWSGTGTISPTLAGSFDLAIPVGTFANLPSRLSFAMQFDWDGAQQSELLAHGSLHLARSALGTIPHIGLLTDDGTPLTGDDDVDIEA